MMSKGGGVHINPWYTIHLRMLILGKNNHSDYLQYSKKVQKENSTLWGEGSSPGFSRRCMLGVRGHQKKVMNVHLIRGEGF